MHAVLWRRLSTKSLRIRTTTPTGDRTVYSRVYVYTTLSLISKHSPQHNCITAFLSISADIFCPAALIDRKQLCCGLCFNGCVYNHAKWLPDCTVCSSGLAALKSADSDHRNSHSLIPVPSLSLNSDRYKSRRKTPEIYAPERRREIVGRTLFMANAILYLSAGF